VGLLRYVYRSSPASTLASSVAVHTTVGISFRGRLKSDLIIAKSDLTVVKVPYKSIVNNSDTFGCIWLSPADNW